MSTRDARSKSEDVIHETLRAESKAPQGGPRVHRDEMKRAGVY